VPVLVLVLGGPLASWPPALRLAARASRFAVAQANGWHFFSRTGINRVQIGSCPSARPDELVAVADHVHDHDHDHDHVNEHGPWSLALSLTLTTLT
jgi:hypothetical protein